MRAIVPLVLSAVLLALLTVDTAGQESAMRLDAGLVVGDFRDRFEATLDLDGDGFMDAFDWWYTDGGYDEIFLAADAEAGTWPWGPERASTHMPAGTFPLGWTRMYGRGRVCVLLLGHDARSFETPEFQRMILNGVEWCVAAA